MGSNPAAPTIYRFLRPPGGNKSWEPVPMVGQILPILIFLVVILVLNKAVTGRFG